MIDELTGEIIGYNQSEPLFRTPYNFNRDENSIATGTACNDHSLTQQQYKDDADINNIMVKYAQTGMLPTRVKPVLPNEYEEVFDFQGAMNILVKSKEEFMKLPAKTRARFENDPAQFEAFFNDTENRSEAEKMGLIEPKPIPEPSRAPASTPEPSGDNKA